MPSSNSVLSPAPDARARPSRVAMPVARFLSLWLPVAAYMAVIFYLSSVSAPPIPQEVSDKTAHAVTYAGLALVIVRALAAGRWSGVTARTLVVAWLMATVYGVTDEGHQVFTAGRTPDLADLAADAIGSAAAAIGAGAWSIIRRL